MSFNPGNGNLASATDVALSNPAQDQVLSYNATTGKWSNVPVNQAPVVKSFVTGSITLVLTDAGTFIDMSNASAMTLTIPNNTDVAFPQGTVIEITQVDVGQVTIAAASGVIVNTAGSSTTTRTKWSAVTLRKIYPNMWLVSGDVA